MGRLAARILALTALLFPLQIVLGNIGADRSLPSRERLDRLAAEGTDVLVLGDSTMDAVSPGDADQRTLSTLIADRLPRRRVGTLAMPGSDLDVQRRYAAYAAGRPGAPADLVVFINPRAFSPAWDLRPGFQRPVEKLRFAWGDTLAFGLIRPLSSLGLYPLRPTEVRDVETAPVWDGTSRAGTVGDFERGTGPAAGLSVERRRFMAAYLTPLEEGHRKLRSLSALIRACRTAGVRVHAVVLPIDVGRGESAVGAAFRRRVEANVGVLRAVCAREGAAFLDLSAELPPEAFDWPRTTSVHEHLAERGRRRVAERTSGFLEAVGGSSR